MSWVDALGWSLIHSLWQGALIWLIAAWVLVACRDREASLRYRVAGACLSLFAVTVVGGFGWRIIDGGRGSVSSGLEAVAGLNMSWLVWSWAIGVAICGLRLAGGLFLVRRWRTDTRMLNAAWQRRIEAARKRLGIRAAVCIAESARVRVPMVVGQLKPVILLPLGLMAQLSRAELEAVLYHELGHVLRRDYLWGLIQHVAETVFFYHPMVWWLGRRMREEREHCCDDLAVSVTGAPLVFAKALARVGELSLRAPRLVPAATGGPLSRRIRRLVEGEGRGPGLDGFAMIPALLLLVSVVSGALTMRGSVVGERLDALEIQEIAQPEESARAATVIERARLLELREQIAVQRRDLEELRAVEARLVAEREHVRLLRNDLAARERELVLEQERARAAAEARMRVMEREMIRQAEVLERRAVAVSRTVGSETPAE